jgi:nuclease S1
LRRWLPCSAACLFFSSPLLAWGTAGHHIVAIIAEARLSETARFKIRRILMDGKYSLADISTCADAIRDARTADYQTCLSLAGPITVNTAPWHYIDIPVPKAERPLSMYCPDGNCVVAALERYRDILRSSQDDAQRRAALLFVVHFMGDIHQPLHCAERACDRGGNSEHVNGGKTLHQIWDSNLVDKAMANVRPADLSSLIDSTKAARWADASIEDIAWESHALAVKRVYRGVPFEDFCRDPKATFPAARLSAKYEKAGARIVRQQLMKAGVRLAALLNSALD